MFMPSGVVAAAAVRQEVYVLTAAGLGGANFGYDVGVLGAAGGTLAPDNDFKNETIQYIVTNVNDFFFNMSPSPQDDNDQNWKELEISGIFALGQETRIFQRSAADTVLQLVGGTQWAYTTGAPLDMLGTNVYDVIIRWDG